MAGLFETVGFTTQRGQRSKNARARIGVRPPQAQSRLESPSLGQISAVVTQISPKRTPGQRISSFRLKRINRFLDLGAANQFRLVVRMKNEIVTEQHLVVGFRCELVHVGR